jgi:anti-sigma-K factor RskA
MITSRNKAPEREDIEALLPWHAAGTLSRRDAERVEQALAQDAELARRFELVREEMAETIHLNETLGAPSARAAQKLFAAIDAEGTSRKGRAMSFQASGWLAGLIEQLSPRTLAWSAAAAGLAIVLQAGLLAGLILSERGATYQTASFGEPTATGSGAFALVRFNPNASVADITKFFDNHKASVVEGPRAGGVYRIRVAATSLSKDELAKVVAQLDENKDIVAFIAPAQ